MPIEITMPQLSDTMTEGTVVKWKKKEGDAVRSGEEIADVETDKATMPMEAFDDGTLAAILIEEGAKVQVGQVLAVLVGKGEDAAAVKKQYAGGKGAAGAAPKAEGEKKAEAAPAKAPEAKAPLPAQAAPKQDPGQEGSTRAEATAGTEEQGRPIPQEQRQPSAVAAEPAGGAAPAGEERVVASPLAKRMAADLGVDLAQVQGSGPNGRIVQKDIEQAAAGAKKAAQAPAAAPSAAPTGVQPVQKPAAGPRWRWRRGSRRVRSRSCR